jgi:hypothetical protein
VVYNIIIIREKYTYLFNLSIVSMSPINGRWIRLIMNCISSVSYSVLINGESFGSILPTCGIRQGDPISPYLFILCAEALSAMLQEAERNRAVTGVPIARGRVRLNHLFFADDSLLFCQAKVPEWARLRAVLERYEQASGQRLNLEKTSIFFSSNTLTAEEAKFYKLQVYKLLTLLRSIWAYLR